MSSSKQQKPLPTYPTPAVSADASVASNKKSKNASPAVKYYLIAYNALSALSWAYILLTLTLHLLGISFSLSPTSSSPHTSTTHPSASARLAALLSPYLPSTFASSGSGSAPKSLQPLLRRATRAYAVVGPETTLVQSAAVLEVVHAALGWVRSPVRTTAMQVASRLFLVWGVAEQFESARTSPLYASMVFAWSLTEVIRYTFYTSSLLHPGSEPYFLLWLRYTTFFILYPLGASSEAFVNYTTLPRSSPLPSLAGWMRGAVWTPYDYVRGVLFLIWWPGLYVMFTYMMAQRRKVLGGKTAGRKLGDKPKTL